MFSLGPATLVVVLTVVLLHLPSLLLQIATTGTDPWTKMDWSSFGRPSRVYSKDHDRFLLCTMAELGYGRGEDLRREVLQCPRYDPPVWCCPAVCCAPNPSFWHFGPPLPARRFQFDHFLRSRSAVELIRRAENQMR